MPKRKRANNGANNGAAATGTAFSLMDGKVDVLEGLVMHREVISDEFEEELIAFVQTQCERGRDGELKKPTYLRASGARSQGNQREAIMYGGFFDFNRARPGKRGLVPSFPPILERLVDHLVNNNYLPSAPTCGKSIPLARRSLLVLGGNSANIAKHCISSCSGPRISITLRKQPPPEWKPDASELVGKGGQPSKQGDDESRVSGGVNNGSDAIPKKKSLSGSAKRKKKMTAAQVGRPAQACAVKHGSSNETRIEIHGRKISNDDQITNNKCAERGSGKLEASNNRVREKQARRNARRLEKKKSSTDVARV